MHTRLVCTFVRLCVLALAIAFAGSSTAAAQQATGNIRGQVTDAVTLRPLPGAQVLVVGTGRGGLANSSGQYLVLNVPTGSHVVRVEILGYGTVEQQVTVAAGQTAALDFAMSQQALELDEIVVTGTAGQTQRRAIGNAVQKFEAAEVTEAVPVASVQELLQARTPGLTLVSNGGGAGDGSQIRLRGSGSLSGRFEPVVFVDGVRIESGNQNGQCNNVVHCTNALDFLNPNDIESIEVIKGPAAATLYGAEAASGVIQIITKKGRPGTGMQWTASMDAGTSDWVLDRPQTYWQCTQANVNDAVRFPGCQGVTAGTVLTDDPMTRHPNAVRGNEGSSDANGPGQYAFNISARGGGELFNYFLSAEKGDEEGIFLNNFAKRQGGRANFGFVPSEKLNFNVNVGYVRQHIRQPLSNNSSNSVLRNAYRGQTLAVNPQWEPGFRGFGPELANQYDLQTRTERFTLGATVNYEPFSWLSNRLTLGLDNNDRNNTQFYPIDQTGQAPWGATNATGAISIFLPDVHTWTVDYSGTVSTDLSENYSSAFSAGMQLNARKYESFTTIGEGLVASQINLVGTAANTRASQDLEEQTSLGFYFQEQVGWRNRLFATAAVRIDDNSAFGREFSLVVYPKAQLSYVISDEDFFDVGWVDQLKLRGAWGQAGSPPEPFTADRTYTAGVTTTADNVVNLLRPSSYGNPNLKAETGSELELGFEASFLDGRMGLDFTYYNQKTRDALIEVPDPPSSGFSGTHFANVGEIANSGIEVLLTATPIYTRNLQWDATVALSTNSNELVTFGDAPITQIEFGQFATVQRHIPRYPMGGFWSTDVVRDASGAPVLTGSGGVTVASDKEYVGPSLPTREIGFTNTVTLFDNVRLFANLDYKGGHYQWCAICSVRSRIDLNTKLVNDPSSDPVDVAVAKSLQTKTWIQNADFIKLREISATYDLPSAVTEKAGVDNAAITLSARNLWMWTKYKFDQEGLGSPDPEVNFDSLSGFNRTDYASIPMLRTFALSVRFAF
ncbi:MAG: SusC/RagA family TonB-linked outer membrane protein [Gemmatimonadota bacterium]